MAEQGARCEPQGSRPEKSSAAGAGPGAARQELAPQRPGRRCSTCHQGTGTRLHRTEKDKLGAGSLSPQPISQVPVVTPRQGPCAITCSTQQALSTDPRDRQPFLQSHGRRTA